MDYAELPFLASDVIKAVDLKLIKAQEMAFALNELPFVSLIESRRISKTKAEIIIFDVQVELGQKNYAYDIRKIERIAVVFFPEDNAFPEVLALRKDFPQSPHLNIRPFEFPRSLCLYDQPYNELKLNWTAIRFIERIREWLSRTAKGTLHEENQPLEPLFIDQTSTVIIPSEMILKDIDMPEFVTAYATEVNKRYAYIIEPANKDTPDFKCIATIIRCSPQHYSLIYKKPATLEELHKFLCKGNIDLIETLRTRLKRWVEKWQTEKVHNRFLPCSLMLIVVFPKSRGKTVSVEATDVWSFLCEEGIKKIGVEIGAWDIMPGGTIGELLIVPEGKNGQNIKLALSPVMFSFSRELASRQNDLSNVDRRKIVIIGVGALGSQIFMNLIRAGYGQWTLIDNDMLLPHNLARHRLNGICVGHSKAECLANEARTIIKEKDIAEALVVDVLNPQKELDKKIKAAFKEAEVVLDCSSSLAVGRYLALDISSSARRISIFLNPSGNDVVLLAEDKNRKIHLDYIEMQYYRYIISNITEMKDHLFLEESEKRRLRYSNSCSDINTSIPQDFVGLHASICSKALRDTISSDKANIAIYRAHPDSLTVRKYKTSPFEVIECKVGDWLYCTDKSLFEKIHEARSMKLPNETGGILIGSFDMQRKIVYIIDTLLSPPDSKEWPTVYIRGCQGLAKKMEEIGKFTLGRLEYVGEWHSHTDGYSCAPSKDDLLAFSWLRDLRIRDGLPAIMLIAGVDRKQAIYIGQMR